MTADVELLPLPIIGEGFNAADIRELMTDYARACVAHATAPLQAEIEALRAEVSDLFDQRLACQHELNAEKDRAERLAEALREATVALDIAGFPGNAKRFRAALHPTAAQEGKESFWPKLPGSGGPDWTGHD